MESEKVLTKLRNELKRPKTICKYYMIKTTGSLGRKINDF